MATTPHDISIQVKNLSKCYQIYNKPQDRLKQVISRHRKQYYREFWALRDISFTVERKETLGIIGRNGSGKSTVLQIISKILTPTTGEIEVHGRVAALLELGAGFNPEFTGRENVYLNGAILGFGRQEMEKRFAEIEAFADIGDFIDQPIKIYSSGMYVRLAFAVQACVEPDILIVDEALSVGDIFFQQKCYDKIRQTIAGGTSCLFVSHDTNAILNLCDSVILLNQGEIEFHGDPEEAVSRYFARIGKRAQTLPEKKLSTETMRCNTASMEIKDILANNILINSTQRHGAKGMELIAAHITDQSGNPTFEITMGDTLCFYVLLKSNEVIHDPSTGIHLYDRLGNLVFAAGTRQLQIQLPDLQIDQMLAIKMIVTFTVQPGEYTFSLGASEPSVDNPNVGYVHDRHEMLGPIVVTANSSEVLPFYGIAQLPMQIAIISLNEASVSS